MAQARQVHRSIAPTGIYLVAAIVAALAVTTLVTLGSMNLFGFGSPTVHHGQGSPALIRAEQEWVRQRLEQSGFVDPAVRSAKEWERQRLLQSSSGN